jgi:hypothetical protein
MTVLPGDFCCIPIHGPVGTLVSVGEWLDGTGFSHYDHAEIYVGNPDKNGPYGYTISAYFEGAHPVPCPCPPEEMPGALWSSGKIELTDQQRKSIVWWAYHMVGTDYSGLDYLALAAHRFHLPIPFLKWYIGRTKHMICSQYVDFCYDAAGVHLFEDKRWPGYVTPADLAELIGYKPEDE